MTPITQSSAGILFLVCLAGWALYLFYTRRILKPSKAWVEIKLGMDRLETEFNTLMGPIRELAKGDGARAIRAKISELEAMLEQLNASISMAAHSSLETQAVAAKLENRVEEGGLALGRSREAMNALNEHLDHIAAELKEGGKGAGKGSGKKWAATFSEVNEKVRDGIGFSKTSTEVFESIRREIYGISRTLKPLIPSTDEQSETARSVGEEIHAVVRLLEAKEAEAQKVMSEAEELSAQMVLFKDQVLKACSVTPSRGGGFFS